MPVCASKRDVLELATIQDIYSNPLKIQFCVRNTAPIKLNFRVSAIVVNYINKKIKQIIIKSGL